MAQGEFGRRLGPGRVPPGGTLVAVKLAPTAILGTRGWLNAASRSGNPAIWLSEPCPDRSPLQLHPPMGGHAYGVRRLRQGLLDKTNTASGCGPIPPTDRRANETFLNRNGFVSHIHRNKPKGRAMHETMRRAYNARIRKSARVSSMYLPSKRIGWGHSSELSGSPEQRLKSQWPISSTTSNALPSCARSPSHDRLVLRKATYSTSIPNCDQAKSMAGFRGHPSR